MASSKINLSQTYALRNIQNIKTYDRTYELYLLSLLPLPQPLHIMILDHIMMWDPRTVTVKFTSANDDEESIRKTAMYWSQKKFPINRHLRRWRNSAQSWIEL